MLLLSSRFFSIFVRCFLDTKSLCYYSQLKSLSEAPNNTLLDAKALSNTLFNNKALAPSNILINAEALASSNILLDAEASTSSNILLNAETSRSNNISLLQLSTILQNSLLAIDTTTILYMHLEKVN
ncbi:581_t:CDS:2 [Cetraspora pellucida]|uniref:581_t:CDS:1 n=1 Tax=Cetraspora pellucida TaxID=1433469 RepID=A0ACA9LPE9_9GLOM|nr:581_t:CDS:2 [Cetraspora pellucida]